MKVTAQQIRQLKEKTGAPVMSVKKVLEEYKGDEKKAFDVLMKEGFEKVEKRSDRETKAGTLGVYIHHTQKVVGIAELFCETDFVARNEIFQALAKDLAMQAASMGTQNFEKQEFIKDSSKKISDLIKEVLAKTGENIKTGRIVRIELGKE